MMNLYIPEIWLCIYGMNNPCAATFSRTVYRSPQYTCRDMFSCPIVQS